MLRADDRIQAESRRAFLTTTAAATVGAVATTVLASKSTSAAPMSIADAR
jgi:hypothetical protein